MKGLVLEGGGAKGSYQVGAYKALKELGYEFDYIVGTSIGAINGAMFVQGDEDLAEEVWQDIKYSTVINVDNDKVKSFLNEDLTISNFMEKVGLIREVISEGGFDTTPFKNLLDSYIDEEKILKSDIKFGLVTVDLTNRKPIEIFADEMKPGQLKKYIYGSSNLPVFKQEPIDGRYLIDGGFYANNPVEMLLDKCDEVVDILLYHDRPFRRVKDLEKVTVICPKIKITEVLNFTKESAELGIKLGYYDTYKVINKLLGQDYYIKAPDCEFTLKIIYNLYLKRKKSYLEEVSFRTFLEKKIPDFISKNKLNQKADYNELMVDVLEKLALRLNLEKFKIYDFIEFSQEILEKLEENNLVGFYPTEEDLLRSITNINKEMVLWEEKIEKWEKTSP